MKLQDAYAAESNQLGTWQLIGYTAPGTKASSDSYSTTTFTYTGAISSAEALTEAGVEKDNAWKAEALVALNDCKKNSTWVLKVTGKTNGVTYVNTITNNGGGTTADCEALTPNFTNIGTKAAAANANGGKTP